jgi:hypothetical protein
LVVDYLDTDMRQGATNRIGVSIYVFAFQHRKHARHRAPIILKKPAGEHLSRGDLLPR